MSDGVIHTDFNHDLSRFVENCEMDRRVIEALGVALTGSDRPLVITSERAWERCARSTCDRKNIQSQPPDSRKASELAGASVQEGSVGVRG